MEVVVFEAGAGLQGCARPKCKVGVFGVFEPRARVGVFQEEEERDKLVHEVLRFDAGKHPIAHLGLQRESTHPYA